MCEDEQLTQTVFCLLYCLQNEEVIACSKMGKDNFLIVS